ncbi:unnamed protein product [Thelazia callipaeda]|uniref:DAGKa domain-containing protein n=1 Tax=Thelazia callipaeda TaxID=103827 RepID=A0A0N5D5F8_THECL|nr:unnamed protein product [Thelazia callipaeda]
MNNYYSIGADAHVALQFHHSRSANPQILNSRLKNRLAYGGLGTIDLFKRTWKLLHEYITLECDGVDLTSKIKEFKFHCVLFHNITYYAGGTVPWGSDDDGNYRPSSCDGKLEVLGFTTAMLAALQMGGKGERIAQCSHARITTTKAIPMQVDGEPCLLGPSIIEITFHSKVPMLRRVKKSTYIPSILRKQPKTYKRQQTISNNYVQSNSTCSVLNVLLISSNEYAAGHDQIERLKETGTEIGQIYVETDEELESVRQKIDKLLAQCSHLKLKSNNAWRFLEYVSNAEEGVFRIQPYHEQFMTLSDICCLDECIMILDNFISSTAADSNSNHTKLTFLLIFFFFL